MENGMEFQTETQIGSFTTRSCDTKSHMLEGLLHSKQSNSYHEYPTMKA